MTDWERRYVEVERENERLRDVMAEAQRMLGELRPDTLERVNAEKDVEIAELKRRVIYAETGADAMVTLLRWIEGMCVDEADHLEIRAGIDRYWRHQK